MKNLKSLFTLLFTIIVFAGAAAAQGHSLHDVHPNDKYVSTDDGFEIGLPSAWVNVENLAAGRRYNWIVNEGAVTVTIRQFSEAETLKTDADVAAFIKGYRDGLQKDPSVAFISEAPANLGAYHGETYLITVDGEKNQIVVLAWGKFSITLLGYVRGKASANDELVFNALKTFELVH